MSKGTVSYRHFGNLVRVARLIGGGSLESVAEKANELLEDVKYSLSDIPEARVEDRVEIEAVGGGIIAVVHVREPFGTKSMESLKSSGFSVRR